MNRRQLLKGLAGGVAAAIAAPALIRTESNEWIRGKWAATKLAISNVPKYSFTDDKNTGIYAPRADKLSLVAGGVEVMRIEPGPPATVFIKRGTRIEDIAKLAMRQA